MALADPGAGPRAAKATGGRGPGGIACGGGTVAGGGAMVSAGAGAPSLGAESGPAIQEPQATQKENPGGDVAPHFAHTGDWRRAAGLLSGLRLLMGSGRCRR